MFPNCEDVKPQQPHMSFPSSLRRKPSYGSADELAAHMGSMAIGSEPLTPPASSRQSALFPNIRSPAPNTKDGIKTHLRALSSSVFENTPPVPNPSLYQPHLQPQIATARSVHTRSYSYSPCTTNLRLSTLKTHEGVPMTERPRALSQSLHDPWCGLTQSPQATTFLSSPVRLQRSSEFDMQRLTPCSEIFTPQVPINHTYNPHGVPTPLPSAEPSPVVSEIGTGPLSGHDRRLSVSAAPHETIPEAPIAENHHQGRRQSFRAEQPTMQRPRSKSLSYTQNPDTHTPTPVSEMPPQQIYIMSKDQKGCRLLQRVLEDKDPETVRIIFEATFAHLVPLMMNPFGNYFCQKLVEHCTQSQLTQIMEKLHPHIIKIAVNQHGTRALQKTIEVLNHPRQIELLVSALDGHVVELIRNLNGNHVVQKCLHELRDSGSQVIYDSVCANLVKVGSHRHGCCVLQRCLDYASSVNRHRLVSCIIENTLELVGDPYGNYVCQYVLDQKVQEYSNALASQLLGKIGPLSTEKFSSNVIEKGLWAVSEEYKQPIVEELIDPRMLNHLLLDSYANYVIQTALDATTGVTRKRLVCAIQATLANTKTPYGRRIMSKLKS